MAYAENEKARLKASARERWGIDGHVLPPALAPENLQDDVRGSAIDYFERHQISWWTSRWDNRSEGMPSMPTGHLNSSQVACVNHLEPARLDIDVAQAVISDIDSQLQVLPTDDGYVDYEWIGAISYLGEPGPRTRGANVTSLDAIMLGEGNAAKVLLAIEWKYLERYGLDSVAESARGTDRVETYRHLLEDPDCPIAVDDIRWLFFEPYYQLTRQTLLAWQMVEHREFGAENWLHLHVVPEANSALRTSGASPNLPGRTLEAKWRSVLKDPTRYRLVSPTRLLSRLDNSGKWAAWRGWLRERYLT